MDNAQHFSLPRLNEPPPAFNVRTTHGERPLADYRDKSLILVSRPPSGSRRAPGGARDLLPRPHLRRSSRHGE